MTNARRADWEWTPGRGGLFSGSPPGRLLAPLVRWDANYYVLLAREGYPQNEPGVVRYPLAFFPLYPLLTRALSNVLGDTFLAAFLLSNAAALLGALVSYFLGAALARPRDGLRLGCMLLAAPGSHFLSYAYPEALFVVLLATALLCIARDQPGLAAACGALASATRSAGVVVALALAVRAITGNTGRARWLCAAACSLLGLAAFALFCHHRYGDALAFAHVQASYDRALTLAGPVRALLRFNVDPDYYLATFLALAICLAMLRARERAWLTASAIFLLWLPMATGTLKAMIRYQSASLPLLWGARSRLVRLVPWLSLSWMAFEAFLFGQGIGHY